MNDFHGKGFANGFRVRCARIGIAHPIEVIPMFPKLRYSKEEFVQRGTELYETQIRPQVETAYHGQIIAIDIETGAFEIAKSTMLASDRLLEQYPDAQIWCIRIGYPAVHRFGSGLLR